MQQSADLPQGIDLSLPVMEGLARAWYIGGMQKNPVVLGEWKGSVDLGGSVNFTDLTLNPHAHGSHTETLGHVCKGDHPIHLLRWPLLIPLTLVTVDGSEDHGLCITLSDIQSALGDGPLDRAIALRTLPSTMDVSKRDHSNCNWPYLHPEAAAWLASESVTELLTESPSIDPEEDGGALAAHRAFWGLSANEVNAGSQARHEATITELIHIPPSVSDGAYALNLQVAAIENDAAPCRPIIYPIEIL